jgi:hypothetical protein
VTICPCCGFKTKGDWDNGCASCGATPVGEPLPRPERELPAYGRSLALVVFGTLTTLAFVAQTIGAFAKNVPTLRTYRETLAAASNRVLDFETWAVAAQTAAWQMKWIAIPFSLLVVFGARKLYRSIKESPERFCGLRLARSGYIASAAVPMMIAVLIGVTVPERLEHRQDGIEAGIQVQGYRFERALNEYKQQFGSYPSDKNDLRRLADPDGSIAELLTNIESAEYKASAEVAAVPSKKPQPLRGAVIRTASVDVDETLNETLSFTNYELRLPGYDKQLGTDDDVFVRDGIVGKATTPARRTGSTTGQTQAVNP